MIMAKVVLEDTKYYTETKISTNGGFATVFTLYSKRWYIPRKRIVLEWTTTNVQYDDMMNRLTTHEETGNAQQLRAQLVKWFSAE